MLKLKQRGDTIVEVLIAIAVVSLVLVAAYTTANRNIRAIQNNQERVQAQHLVEGQIEALKSNNGLSTDKTCFDQQGSPASGVACTISTDGSGASYTLSVVSAGSTYTISAKWTSLNANASNDANVTMYYRLQ